MNTTITPVYVAGNATIHAGKQIGTYSSGMPKYRKLCARVSRNERHDAAPAEPQTQVTCKRCLAKLS